jgi:succinyl-CoA synthetase alpha subunit
MRMGFLCDRSTRVLVQGITGNFGKTQARLMLDYGTEIVAGVTPGKAGESVEGVPVYDTVFDAVAEQAPIDASVVYVPARFSRPAIEEAISARVPLIVVITEGIPLYDEMYICELARQSGSWLIGPNCPGIMVPGETSLGMIPPSSTSQGNIAVLSRSGTLTFEITKVLSDAGYGQSVCVGIGGDRVIGRDFTDYLRLAEEDENSRVIILVGEIGGDAEEKAANVIRNEISKPVIGLLVGRHAPPGRRMGHAGAMISGNTGTIESKEEALASAGVHLVSYLWDLPDAVRQLGVTEPNRQRGVR